ncbi:MAG TPA: response regulator transcription factor [Gemmatimonadaceae bacterium]|jgi:DNA-binding response OmpR family regulator|nr:response regulator transcription factor [Gemmatimonadaceae bacterium]
MTRILVVEDNDNMRRGLCDMLEADGFEPVAAADGTEALASAERNRPDLILLDLMLPGTDGARVLKALRAVGVDSPVLVLTAKSDEDEKVRLLGIGADDYVTKPFGRRELGARIAAILRRAPPSRAIHIGDIVIDLSARTVVRAGVPVSLAPKEYDLLVALAQRAGTVVTRATLLREVWGYESDVVSRTVDLHVLELRKRLGSERIVTVRKVGYRM